MLKENDAKVLSLIQVQTAQAMAYANLKKSLGLSNSELLNYIKTKVINNYSGKDMAISLESPETKRGIN
jgi:hypothetical protein